MFARPLVAILLALCVGPTVTAAAERPNAMRLFPERTVFFLRSPEASDFTRRITESRLFTDPDIAPFLEALFGKVDDAFAEGPGEATGGGLADLMKLFEGEFAFGLVARRNEAPGVLLLADTVSQLSRDTSDIEQITAGPERATQLIESITAAAQGNGAEVAEETIGSTTALVVRPENRPNRAWGVCERGGVLLISNDRLLLESALTKWDQAEGLPSPIEEDPEVDDEATEDEDAARRERRLRQRYASSLSENPAYTESLRECVEERIGGGDIEPPHVTAFVDPIGIFRGVSEGNVGMRFALATLPVLGLDGIEGAAAAMWVDVGDWDSLIRAHLLLDNPRAGILKMVRLAPTDTAPGPTVPADVASYQCGALNFAEIFEGSGKLYDKIRGEGKFAEEVAKGTKAIGVEIETILPHFTGRFVSLMAYGDPDPDGPQRVTPARAFLLTIDDPEWIGKTVRQVLEKTGASRAVEWDEYAGVPMLVNTSAEEASAAANVGREGRNVRVNRQFQLASMAIVGDQLILCETQSLLRKLIDTHKGDRERLADHLPFRLTSGRANRLGEGAVGVEEGRMLIYEDPGEQFRQWHAAGSSDANREQLDQMAEFAPPMRWLRDALDEVGMPPLDALMKHAAPSGSAVYDTPRGFRYAQFAFKLEDDE